MTVTATPRTESRPEPRTATQQTIAVDRIDADPIQPRKHFDESALDALGQSMRTLGQLQSISVRYVPATRRYTLISGERRWRAAQRVGITELHALVLRIDDAGVLPRAVAENLGRTDMTPMEEADAFARLVAEGHTVAEVAALSGKTVEYVGYRIDLLHLIEAAREALNVGHLPIGTAWYVCRLSPAGQQRFLRKWVRGEFATIRDAEAFVNACRTNEVNEQTGMFPVAEEMTPERREHIETRRRAVTSRVDRLAGAGQVLADLANTDPVDLALLLSGLPGGIGGYRMRVDHLRTMAGKAAATLRRAGAIAAAAGPDSVPTDVLV